ncbi:hypothetical protein G6F57_000990 [Rhizopus arrhizus]|uniref:BHLH domain-containing protein n=1 Tax=Rhizopus oryzae TaxID=64495 RepID=A0A9P6XKH7_RHIOR|nr:hypothetical protein G6F24_000037 [Rhizopus arrhizus]KAG1423734.1 hypothetical protein G6F58_002695 [Rhizopus delemar]KAG0797896.1 hypothetical protein G6F21_000165 [Rhizopus arrhizus]KAG0801093.1 hypothetical protein G6F22_001584 [Rhizopus arrhizus]KAG0820104.1 hypothetical protein G6F20_000223 [Rhizopus arrhizus]
MNYTSNDELYYLTEDCQLNDANSLKKPTVRQTQHFDPLLNQITYVDNLNEKEHPPFQPSPSIQTHHHPASLDYLLSVDDSESNEWYPLPPSNHSNDSANTCYKGKYKLLESYHPYKALHPPQKNTKTHRRRKQPHELLSEEQKKANHIASEQKRRQNIKIGLDQLIDIVPSLNHGNRSEALILQKSVEHIQCLISLKNELKTQLRDLQDVLGDTNYEESSDDETYGL